MFEELEELKNAFVFLMPRMRMPIQEEGFSYLQDAVEMAQEDMEVVGSVTKLLYPEIARRYNTTGGSVERAIRDVTEWAWLEGDRFIYEKMFGYSRDNGAGHPTNSEFIAAIALEIM